MRKTYLDNIKWITVVIVVIYHVIYMYNGIEVFGIGPFNEVQYQDAYSYIVYPWFMLLLFVISGMSARFSISRHTNKEFIKTRTDKYLVPSTLGLLAFGWALGYYNLMIPSVLNQMGAVPKPVLFLIMCVSGCGPLWYIQMLWLFSVLLVLFRKIGKDRLYNKFANTPAWLVVTFTVLIWGSAQILNTPVITVYRFGIYGMGFIIGYLVLSHDEVMDRLEKWWHVLVIVALVLCVAFVIIFFGRPYAESEVLTTLLCNAYAWIGTIAILAFMKKWGNYENKFSKFMNRKAWGLYLFHYLPIAMCAYYLSKYCPSTPAIVCYILVTISGFAGAFILYEIISRIPVYRWLVCGIRGGK